MPVSTCNDAWQIGGNDVLKPECLGKLPLCIPPIGQHGEPSVLVNIEAAFWQYMALARDEVGLHNPSTVQFPPDVIRIKKAFSHHIAVKLRLQELIVVVRKIDFLLANDLPVVAIKGAVKQVDFVKVG